MGFDLIGKNMDDSCQPGDPSPFGVSIVISGRHYNSLNDYLEAMELPKNTIRFSCSNRHWHTIWEFLQYSTQNVSSSHKFIGTETDFKKGAINDGHFINEVLTNSIVTCCQKGIEDDLFDRYINEYSVSDKDKSNYLDMVAKFISFCKKSGGFYIF